MLSTFQKPHEREGGELEDRQRRGDVEKGHEGNGGREKGLSLRRRVLRPDS